MSISVKTISEVDVKTNSFTIFCFSDMNEDGTKNPSIYKSNVLDSEKIIDSEHGFEGDLMISRELESDAELNDAELNISVRTGDDADKYDVENEDLIYNEE